ncbi:hypothetical protein [Peribacillus muralis]|uniref:hypothetical protein n=1 Tax=Peribacillus muralis TaxID=264697 RepID=UPI00366F78B0
MNIDKLIIEAESFGSFMLFSRVTSVTREFGAFIREFGAFIREFGHFIREFGAFIREFGHFIR